MSEKDLFACWAVLEVMGHRRLGGYVTEQTLAGVAMLRIDIPGKEGPTATQLYHPSAIFCLTPTTEEVARAVAYGNAPRPVHAWELPKPDLVHETIASQDDEEDDQPF